MCSDAALVMQIKAGRNKAFGELVERHKKFAFNIALGLVSNRDDAYDISQEAFLRVYRSAKSYDQDRPFLPWFYTIIANLSHTWLRRRSRVDNRMVDLDDTSFLLVDRTTPEDHLIARESVQRLHSALKQLSFSDREIISLQHFRGMSYEEISKLMKIPKGTVMSRLYYARRKLAELMKEQDG